MCAESRKTEAKVEVPRLSNADLSSSDYHCTAEWHLSRMKSRYCAPLYTFALHLSNKTQLFYAAQDRVAEYFGCSRRTIWGAVQELENARFFVRKTKRQFLTIVYEVLDHTNWAKKNPGHCTSKIQMPWSPEGLELGRQLHALSGGRLKFRPEQIAYLKRKFTDEQIEYGFRRLLATQNAPVDRHGFLDMKNSNWAVLCLG
jgi:biotin operon repressor